MTKQELFDKMWAGLESQGWRRCQKNGGSCAFSDGQGNHCAVGWCLPEIGPEVEGGLASLGFRFPELVEGLTRGNNEIYTFLAGAQACHDHADDPSRMRQRFVQLATNHNLTIPGAKP